MPHDEAMRIHMRKHDKGESYGFPRTVTTMRVENGKVGQTVPSPQCTITVGRAFTHVDEMIPAACPCDDHKPKRLGWFATCICAGVGIGIGYGLIILIGALT
jgi:hypothetical protein